jgi:hypothetical protein
MTVTVADKTVGLYWYAQEANFGDPLGAAILRDHGWPVRWARPSEANLVATGSVLHHLPPSSPALVLGSGLLGSSVRVHLPNAVVLAVRGPLTAERLTCSGSFVLGDLGLLAADLVAEAQTAKQWRVVSIPHYSDRQAPHFMSLSHHLRSDSKIIDVQSDTIESIVRNIAASDLVVSSSLHGLVVAAGLGVPAVWIASYGDVAGGSFKFDDFYASFGMRRKPIKISGDESPDELMAKAWVPNECRLRSVACGLREAIKRASEKLWPT